MLTVIAAMLLVQAAPPVAPPQGQAQVLSLRSDVLNETREVWIHAPDVCRQAPCDLIVALDAHALFPLAVAYTEVMRRMGRMSPVLVVGLPSLSPSDRVRNFTTAPGASERDRYPQAGGAGRFLEFLQRDVLPSVQRQYPIGPRRVLAGHSLAGLFVVHALAQGADFDTYVAISPTLGWNQGSVLAAVRATHSSSVTSTRGASARSEAQRSVVTMYASVARDTPVYLEHFERLQHFVRTESPAGLTSKFQTFADEDHVTTIAPALQWAIKSTFVTEQR
jgi:uncharacterized protein